MIGIGGIALVPTSLSHRHVSRLCALTSAATSQLLMYPHLPEEDCLPCRLVYVGLSRKTLILYAPHFSEPQLPAVGCSSLPNGSMLARDSSSLSLPFLLFCCLILIQFISLCLSLTFLHYEREFSVMERLLCASCSHVFLQFSTTNPGEESLTITCFYR